jgi:hypothetical protein
MIEELVYKKILEHIKSNYKIISVTPGKKIKFNYVCHKNSAHIAIVKKHKKIAMLVYIENNQPIIHFVNYKNGKYIDNTLGHFCPKEAHFIRYISKEDFYKVDKIFSNFRKELRSHLPNWLRLISTYSA